MSIKYKFRNQEQLYFVTFAVVYWITYSYAMNISR
jgi:hypothetical protein